MLNKLCVIGNLGTDAALKEVNGSPMCNFNIAVSSRSAPQEEPQWFNCSLWGKRAAALSHHLKKGLQVYLEGPIKVRKWTDKQGAQRVDISIMVNELHLLSAKSATTASNIEDPWVKTGAPSPTTPRVQQNLISPPTKAPPAWNDTGVEDDDVPF